MAEREERGTGGGGSRGFGGYGSRPSPSAEIGSPIPAEIGSVPAKAAVTPQPVIDLLKSVYTEVAAAMQESKALHERLGRHAEAETARVIAARLATIEGHIKSLV